MRLLKKNELTEGMFYKCTLSKRTVLVMRVGKTFDALVYNSCTGRIEPYEIEDNILTIE